MKGNKNDIVLVGKLSGYIMVGVLYIGMFVLKNKINNKYKVKDIK